MHEFKLPDMSCGHCVKAVTQACKDVDPGATVEVDLASKQVTVESQAAGRDTFARALQEAGYTPA